ncbi:mucosa-associated lymphoid tissue lymphoma translocation protein 1-like [Diadema antillarum]|uniref:mucosa-associated lymphoid tissue lymphoma translocation protein 1-like n=1 Tax=Diadema antillarum TaxID=105358 RepID=UPI003A84180F
MRMQREPFARMHPSLNPDLIITDLPYKILDQLAGLLDIPDGTNKPYWKALIAVIPGNIYTDVQINRFSMDGLRLNGGSSALSLLRDLGNRHNKTVKQLASYLNKLHYEQALKLIKSPEQLEIIQQPVSSNVVAGETAVFTCEARGFPYPRYQWYRAYTRHPNGDIIYEEVDGAADAILDLPQVSHDQSGGYCCKVYHLPQGGQNYVFTEWAYLTVLQVPVSPETASPPSSLGLQNQIHAKPIIVEQPEARIEVTLGRELTMSCRASGCPKPNYQWYRIELDPKSGISTKNPIKGFTSHMLEFAQANSSDMGRYICHAYNSVGEDWSSEVTVSVATVAETVKRRCRIEILRNPCSVVCVPGMDQKFECVASCPSSKLFYQWFKNDQILEEETSHQLCFDRIQMSDAGVYFCRVIAENNQSEDSERATLHVPSVVHQRTFTASDKVALLIANEDYRSAVQLVAPGSDMHKLALKLTCEMDFKVVSLLNLSLAEMRKALDIFCTLLNNGVYGLFYFSGHGFEHDGQTYMVPSDAASGHLPEECLCAQEVQDKMQSRDTALNCILLDICRKLNENAQGPTKKYHPIVKGNTVFGYAAQTNSEAYEVKSAGYAVFTHYLVKRIHEIENVFILLYKILEDVKKDKDAGNRQFPALMGDLNEGRTLMDVISYTGRTTEFNSRQIAWENAHKLPQDMRVESKFGSIVLIQYESQFSNVMHIVTMVLDHMCPVKCDAKLGHFPLQLDIKVDEEFRKMEIDGRVCDVRCRVTKVQNVQKLERDLTFRLILTSTNLQGQKYTEEHSITIDKPLISEVWLLDTEGYPDSTSYSESSSYPESTSNSLLS